MPRVGRAQYKGMDLLVFEAWSGMHAYFVMEHQADPDCMWGVRKTFEEALEAGAEAIREVKHEQSPRSNS